MAAVHHVIVERDHHQRRIGDDAAELTGIERGVFHRLLRAQGAELFEDVLVGQRSQRRVGDGHDY